MLSPYLALLLFFGVAPVLYALGLSFMDTIDWVFWGFTNYEFVLQDFRLVESITNVFQYVAIWLTMMLIGIGALSLTLDALSDRSAAILRTSFFLPGAITSSAIVILWLFLLDPAVSPYGSLFEALGWENRQQVVSRMGYPMVFSLMAYLAYSGGWIVVIGGALEGHIDGGYRGVTRGRRKSVSDRHPHQAAHGVALARPDGNPLIRQRHSNVRRTAAHGPCRSAIFAPGLVGEPARVPIRL